MGHSELRGHASFTNKASAVQDTRGAKAMRRHRLTNRAAVDKGHVWLVTKTCAVTWIHLSPVPANLLIDGKQRAQLITGYSHTVF